MVKLSGVDSVCTSSGEASDIGTIPGMLVGADLITRPVLSSSVETTESFLSLVIGMMTGGGAKDPRLSLVGDSGESSSSGDCMVSYST